MCKKCLCIENRFCDIWIEYQVALHSLREAEELSHQNWNEIRVLYRRVCQLEEFIRERGLPLPEDSN